MASPDEIAICLHCGNEWKVKTGGTGKKRKCPVCGKYRVKMKSEVKEDGDRPNPDGHKPADSRAGGVPDPTTVQGNGVDRATPGEDSGEMGEKRRKREENSPHSPENSPVTPMNSPGENEENNEEEKLQEAMKSVGGIPPLAVVGIIAVLGVLAFCCWFLPRRTQPKNHQQVPAVPPVSGRVQNAVRRLN